MTPLRRRRPLASRVASGGRSLAPLLAAALLAAACATEVPPLPPSPPSPDAAVPAVGEGLVIVLPPADLLAEAERDHLRRSVDRAIESALPDGVDAGVVTVLEPADTQAVVDAVERAVRRVGPGGTVCVLGAGVRERIAPVLALYPAARACMLHAAPLDDEPHLAVDVDLDGLGRALGAAARTFSQGGTVLVLHGEDPMLDRRWRAGVVAAVTEPAEDLVAGRAHTVRSAEEVLRLLEDQAALLAEGVVPGSPEALTSVDGIESALGPNGELLPPARVLPPVAVVVVDASAEAALLVAALAERDLPVVGPRSLLDGGVLAGDAVVLRWQVRWDLPLRRLLDAAITSGVRPEPVTEDVVTLELGPVSWG